MPAVDFVMAGRSSFGLAGSVDLAAVARSKYVAASAPAVVAIPFGGRTGGPSTRSTCCRSSPAIGSSQPSSDRRSRASGVYGTVVVAPGLGEVVVPRGADVDARDVADVDVGGVDVDGGAVVADDDVDVPGPDVVVARAADVGGGGAVVALVACVGFAVPCVDAVAGRTRM